MLPTISFQVIFSNVCREGHCSAQNSHCPRVSLGMKCKVLTNASLSPSPVLLSTTIPAIASFSLLEHSKHIPTSELTAYSTSTWCGPPQVTAWSLPHFLRFPLCLQATLSQRPLNGPVLKSTLIHTLFLYLLASFISPRRSHRQWYNMYLCQYHAALTTVAL